MIPYHRVVYELTVESVEENRIRWIEWENRMETPDLLEYSLILSRIGTTNIIILKSSPS